MLGCDEGEDSAVAVVGLLMAGEAELELFVVCLIRCKIVSLWWKD